MTLRRSATYVVATATLVAGVWLATGGASSPPVSFTDADAAALSLHSTGHSQVHLEAPPQTVAAPAVRHEEPVTSSVQMDGRRRADDLKGVLDQLQNEPVYVEGLDGPADDAKTR